LNIKTKTAIGSWKPK